MRKINIKDLELNIDIIQTFNLFYLEKTIIIDINGNIYNNKENINNSAIIYFNQFDDSFSSINDAKSLALKLFESYKPVINGTICKIKPLPNWQSIIDLNKETMLYFDHQSDGVELFEDKVLEDYGWYANALGINYREISEFIEENCDGTLVFYDNQVQFNGFCIVDNIEDVREKVKAYIIKQTLKSIDENSIDLDDEDVIESLEYFEIRV